MNDTEAMAAIHRIMDGAEWSPDTLERIAEVVRATGREVRDPNDMPDEDEDGQE